METLQATFYVMGIIFMVLNGVLLLGIIILIFYLWKKIAFLADEIHTKLDMVSETASHPEKLVSSVGEALAETAMMQVKKMFTKK